MKTRKLKLAFLFLIALLLYSGCGQNDYEIIITQPEMTTAAETTTQAEPKESTREIIEKHSERIDNMAQSKITPAFWDWLERSCGSEVMDNIAETLAADSFNAESWHRLTGSTFHVLWDDYQAQENSVRAENCKKLPGNGDNDTVINIVGDVSLADNWRIMPHYDERDEGVYGILSEEAVNEMQSADIMLVNSEFTFSNRGDALEKQYTFRGSPERVKIYNELGVDIVSLANNHVYDFGKDAFDDTLSTLLSAGIPYIGGGQNIEEARRPYYFVVNGRKFAFVAATRAEKYIITPEAGEDSAGVLRAYDPAMFIETIAEAKRNSDYVIAYIHWGTENSHDLEEVQRETGRAYLDAGADIVVGAHAHVLQGIEFYNGKPIVYNLGNFIFNALTIDTGMLKIHIDENGKPTYEFLTCLQENCRTAVVDGDERARILNLMEDISYGVSFDENGFFTETPNS